MVTKSGHSRHQNKPAESRSSRPAILSTMSKIRPPATADLVVHPDWIVPVVPREKVLTDHSIVVSDGRISGFFEREIALTIDCADHCHLTGQALLPGFINAHGHSAMSLFRGFADDYPLMDWLNEHIWPAEASLVSEEFVRDGTNLALIDLLLGGTTTFSDQYFFPDITAQCVDTVGLRAQLVFPVISVETAWARSSEECLQKGLALRDNLRGHPRIDVGFGAHSTYSVDKDALKNIATLAHELDAIVQIHLHETQGEVEASLEQCGDRPIDILAQVGMLGPKTQCVHMTALSRGDFALLKETNSHVVHCPRSNMKIASGICPTQRLLDHGINVALGTDGAASNNRLNMLAELQSAALVAKLESAQATALPAMAALELATINGAQALGMERAIGSLEIGKDADMIAIDLREPHTQPLNNVISQLVYSTDGHEVTHSWVQGRPLVKDREVIGLDVANVVERAKHWSTQLASLK